MTTSRTNTRAGFTFLELLVVVVIIAVLTAMVGPSLTATDAVRVKSASRGLMQMSRYARTMAVLRQQTMMLSITSDGKLSISPKAANGPSAPVEESEEPSGEEKQETGGMYDAAEEKVYKQVAFSVEFDDDQFADDAETSGMVVQQDDEDGAGTHKTFTIPYAGNGRCLPYRVIVSPMGEDGLPFESGWSLAMTVDRFGNAKIEDEENSRGSSRRRR